MLSSCLFSSVYIFSKSLELINKSLSINKNIPKKLIFINGLTFLLSGSTFIYIFYLSL